VVRQSPAQAYRGSGGKDEQRTVGKVLGGRFPFRRTLITFVA
jgi:hypothetical protein